MAFDSQGTPDPSGFTSLMSSRESKDFRCHSNVLLSLVFSRHFVTFLVLIHLADEWTEHSRVSVDVRIYFESASAHLRI